MGFWKTIFKYGSFLGKFNHIILPFTLITIPVNQATLITARSTAMQAARYALNQQQHGSPYIGWSPFEEEHTLSCRWTTENTKKKYLWISTDLQRLSMCTVYTMESDVVLSSALSNHHHRMCRVQLCHTILRVLCYANRIYNIFP